MCKSNTLSFSGVSPGHSHSRAVTGGASFELDLGSYGLDV